MKWKMTILYKSSSKKWVQQLKSTGREEAKSEASFAGPNHLRNAVWHPGPNNTVWKENDFAKITLTTN